MAKIKHLYNDLEKRVRDGEWRPGEAMPSRNTLADIYGVSPATVSIAVRNLEEKGLVHIVPSKGVYVGEVNHSVAVRKKRALIGIAGNVVPSQEEIMQSGVDAVMAQAIMDGVWQSAREKQLPVTLMPAMDDKPGFDLDDCRSLGLGGLILIGIDWHTSALQLRRAGFPIMLAHQPVPPTPINFVDFDNADMLRRAVDAFAQAGHQRIGVISSRGTVPGYFDMMKREFIDAVQQHGLVYNVNHYWRHVDANCVAPDFGEAAEIAVESLLSMDDPPSAVFCWGLGIAEKMCEVMARRGLEIAKHISLITTGYLNETSGDLSGFVVPYKALGEALLDHLLATICDPFYCVQHLLALTYIDRSSVAAPVPWPNA